MTPYFIFVRDSLSYLTLLGLHFFICLSPSRIPFSGVEWAIFIFFFGRVVMEAKQLTGAKVRSKEKGSKKLRVGGPKYMSCKDIEENDEPDDTDSKREQQNGVVLTTLIKYIR